MKIKEKIIEDRNEVKQKIENLRKEGKKIVFTNGSFDIIHPGHVTYLEDARALGDLLVVGVNTDSSVKQYKGDNRPVNPLEKRMVVLAALESVGLVVPFSEPTPEQLIAELQPDVHVKGGDYTVDQLPEAKIVQSYNGVIRIIPFLDNNSTTAIINKIIEVYKS